MDWFEKTLFFDFQTHFVDCQFWGLHVLNWPHTDDTGEVTEYPYLGKMMCIFMAELWQQF